MFQVEHVSCSHVCRSTTETLTWKMPISLPTKPQLLRPSSIEIKDRAGTRTRGFSLHRFTPFYHPQRPYRDMTQLLIDPHISVLSQQSQHQCLSHTRPALIPRRPLPHLRGRARGSTQPGMMILQGFVVKHFLTVFMHVYRMHNL